MGGFASSMRAHKTGLVDVEGVDAVRESSDQTPLTTGGQDCRDWSVRPKLNTPALVDCRLDDLIDGFDAIAELRIPYARLPKRVATAYAAEFDSWSQMRSQTLGTLMARPKTGDGTVRALLTAAREAVADVAAASIRVGARAAVERLVAQLSERDVIILEARMWAMHPVTQPVVAERLGVHKAAIQRNEPRARARFAELLASPGHQEVSEHAADLRRRLGPFLPWEQVVEGLLRVGVQPDGRAAEILLHLAGPYLECDGWCENTSLSGRHRVEAAVSQAFDCDGAVAKSTLVAVLREVGLTSHRASAYLSALVGVRRFGNVWVRWGSSTADKAEAVLHVRGEPATPEVITEATSGEVLLGRLQEALSADARFMRTSRRQWGLRIWGRDEYGGISDEMAARIDAAGGWMRIADLTGDLLAAFPDVAEGSIRTKMRTLAFITKDGMIRRRTASDPLPAVPALNAARGVFRLGNEIRYAMPVTHDVLRGSGSQVHQALSMALGVSPGGERSFTSAAGDITVAWRLSTTNGPDIGSMRYFARALGVSLGDTLVLAFDIDRGSLEVSPLAADVVGVDRLRRLLGRRIRNPLAALATSLGCRRDDVVRVLCERGDDELAEFIAADLTA